MREEQLCEFSSFVIIFKIRDAVFRSSDIVIPRIGSNEGSKAARLIVKAKVWQPKGPEALKNLSLISGTWDQMGTNWLTYV